MGRVRRARRRGVREESAFTSRNESPARNLADLGWIRRALAPLWWSGELPGRSVVAGPGGHGEGLRRNRGDVVGTESGTYCDERSAANTGTLPDLPRIRAASAEFEAGPTVGRSVREGAEPP